MKLKYKIQQYQSDAVNAVVDCFNGQPHAANNRFLIPQDAQQGHFIDPSICNAELTLDDKDLLANIQTVQTRQRLNQSGKLNKSHDIPINLDVEMETGTGKTYCYTKTIFELNKRYGWTKFIIIVPSVAIREGVYFSLKSTEDHFLSQYGKRINTFIYNSDRMSELRNFENSSDLTVMIMNYQAFASPPKKGKTETKAQRKIYGTPDDFQSRRPIEIIASARPVLILDEPQRLEGKATVAALPLFKPLMALRYSATHKTIHDKIFCLDALDAFQQKLVKKIEAVGVEVKNLTGGNAYLYLEGIDISRSNPTARIDMQVKLKSGKIKRQVRRIKFGDDLYQKSNNLDAYFGFKVDEINYTKGAVSFENNEMLYLHQVTNDPTEIELRRLQIRQAIESHLIKEQQLYAKNIKVLSLFFIDSVINYRDYSRQDEQGQYARIFQEEYQDLSSALMEKLADDDSYKAYLANIVTADTHRGYFSIDRKTGHLVDPKESESNESTASDYDLILKDKERLLSFDEPTRFIFSHSALREGWDNPNVFVICLLKPVEGSTEIRRRQELGRGLRIAVDQDGNRTDHTAKLTHEINTLTVVANESFKDYSEGLQQEFSEALSNRQRKANLDFFWNQTVTNATGEERFLTYGDANRIHHYLIRNNFINDDDHVLPNFIEAYDSGDLPLLPNQLLEPFSVSIHDLVASIFTKEPIPRVEDGRRKKENLLAEANFSKAAFQEIWKRINHKMLFNIEFEDDNLIQDCVSTVNTQLSIENLHYVITRGEQNTDATPDEIADKKGFYMDKTERVHAHMPQSDVEYDLVSQIAIDVDLSRKTICKILAGITVEKFEIFKANPEQFISRIVQIISEKKASLFVNGIEYSKSGRNFESSIFTDEVSRQSFTRCFQKADKHIYEYVIVDSSHEHELAKEMEIDDSVIVYAKMPRGFYVPTPFGKYNPDWAICFERKKIKHIYFMAETKGTTQTSDLREKENAKISCARKFFETLNDAIKEDKVKYEVVKDINDLISFAELRNEAPL